MEINKRYIFKDTGVEFIVTGLGHKNVHYQILDESCIRTLPKGYWSIYVDGEAPEVIQGDSKLIFKFIK